MNQEIITIGYISKRGIQDSNNIVLAENCLTLVYTASKATAWRLDPYIIIPYLPNLFAQLCNCSWSTETIREE